MAKEHFSVIFKEKIRTFKKNIKVDSDKSLSIRSILLGSVCEGTSKIENLLESEDSISSINFIKKLGIKTKKIRKGEYLIFGKGLGAFSSSKNMAIDLGNSGTLCRLGSGLLATNKNINLKIFGDKSLSKRNLKTLINLLKNFGATFYPKNKYQLPLRLVSSQIPVGIKYEEKGGSAQIKSAAILAGLNSFGKTKVINENKFSTYLTYNGFYDFTFFKFSFFEILI